MLRFSLLAALSAAACGHVLQLRQQATPVKATADGALMRRMREVGEDGRVMMQLSSGQSPKSLANAANSTNSTVKIRSNVTQEVTRMIGCVDTGNRRSIGDAMCSAHAQDCATRYRQLSPIDIELCGFDGSMICEPLDRGCPCPCPSHPGGVGT
mmetsp:Transcript_116737/g.218412  ORF Transcript_116737/g.218412 Transcript_116737/m.218412 type:complete len:154 (+) Transcript_116737:81-542(+)